MAPTSFDQPRRLLLSQSNLIYRDYFELTLSRDSRIVVGAVVMLLTETNWRKKKARELLLRLRNTGRFADMDLLGPPIWTYANVPAAGLASTPEKTVPESMNGRVAPSVLPETTDNPSGSRKLFMSWFRSPVSVAVGESRSGPSHFPNERSGVCGRPLIELPVVDIKWFG
jgi:hypothetical protein